MNDTLLLVDDAFISKERSEKLELLIHLVANSSQATIVCGPKGIGKSTLVKALIERKKNAWQHCLLSATADMNFDAIIAQIAEITGEAINNPLKKHNQETSHNKFVLFIDDAGLLVPGVFTQLLEYALKNPSLRLVCNLTPDEIFIKNRTDAIIDECYFIEIPPLSEKQCGDYLLYLATKSTIKLPINAITEHLTATVYRNSQGIPARILEQLPQLVTSKTIDHALLLLIAAVAILVAIALAAQWLSATGHL